MRQHASLFNTDHSQKWASDGKVTPRLLCVLTMIEGAAGLWKVVSDRGVHVLELNAGTRIRLAYKRQISLEDRRAILDELKGVMRPCEQLWRDDQLLEESLSQWLNLYIARCASASQQSE